MQLRMTGMPSVREGACSQSIRGLRVTQDGSLDPTPYSLHKLAVMTYTFELYSKFLFSGSDLHYCLLGHCYKTYFSLQASSTPIYFIFHYQIFLKPLY